MRIVEFNMIGSLVRDSPHCVVLTLSLLITLFTLVQPRKSPNMTKTVNNTLNTGSLLWEQCESKHRVGGRRDV